MTPDQRLQQEIDWANQAEGSLQGYDCPGCKNRGYVTIARDGYKMSRECTCMAIRRTMRRIEKSGLKDLLDRYTFDRYQTPGSWQESVKSLAKRYLTDNDGKWFAALGAVGSGKTHICTAICGEMINAGFETRYMRWKDDARQLKAFVNDGEEYGRLIEPLQKVRVLYIDDFFKTKRDEERQRYEQPTQADINIAFEILNARYSDRKLITIISSERNIDDLLSIDEAVGSRIYEQCKEYCLNLNGQDKNWRLKT